MTRWNWERGSALCWVYDSGVKEGLGWDMGEGVRLVDNDGLRLSAKEGSRFPEHDGVLLRECSWLVEVEGVFPREKGGVLAREVGQRWE